MTNMETPQTYKELGEITRETHSSEKRLELLHNFVFRDRALQVISILETHEGHFSWKDNGDTRDIDLQGLKDPVTRLVTKKELHTIKNSTKEELQILLLQIKMKL